VELQPGRGDPGGSEARREAEQELIHAIGGERGRDRGRPHGRAGELGVDAVDGRLVRLAPRPERERARRVAHEPPEVGIRRRRGDHIRESALPVDHPAAELVGRWHLATRLRRRHIVAALRSALDDRRRPAVGHADVDGEVAQRPARAARHGRIQTGDLDAIDDAPGLDAHLVDVFVDVHRHLLADRSRHHGAPAVRTRRTGAERRLPGGRAGQIDELVQLVDPAGRHRPGDTGIGVVRELLRRGDAGMADRDVEVTGIGSALRPDRRDCVAHVVHGHRLDRAALGDVGEDDTVPSGGAGQRLGVGHDARGPDRHP
jgi:hypothetical protein